MKKVSFIVAFVMIITLCGSLCACFEQTFALPTVEGAESITISSGACKMNVNDSVEKFVKIFEGLKLAEVEQQTVSGEENEKYNAALEEIEGAHHVVATLANENKVEFYFTDDGEVYYLDGETLFASKSKIDATAALATAKVGEGVKAEELISMEEVDVVSLYPSSLSSTFYYRTEEEEINEFFEQFLNGLLLTDDESVIEKREQEVLLCPHYDDSMLRCDIYNVNIYDEQYNNVGHLGISCTGVVFLHVDDKEYVNVENVYIDYDSLPMAHFFCGGHKIYKSE